MFSFDTTYTICQTFQINLYSIDGRINAVHNAEADLPLDVSDERLRVLQ